MKLPEGLTKQDWRKKRKIRHEPHLTIRWFHWSWRPRIVLCYYNNHTHEQRCMSLNWRQWHD